MAKENIICFERITQEFYTLFDYTFQEGSKIKLLNINTIQGKYGISIDQTDHIMKISFNNIGKQKKMKSNFSTLHYQHVPPLNKHFSWIRLLLEQNWRKSRKHMDDP